MKATITTSSYTIKHSDYIKVLFTSIILNYWAILISFFSLLFALSLYDIRCIYILLIFIFIIPQFMLTNIYIWYALKPEVRHNLINHSITISDTNIVIHETKTDIILKWNKFSEMTYNNKYIILALSSSKHLYLLIPFASFKTKEDLTATINLINSNLSNSD